MSSRISPGRAVLGTLILFAVLALLGALHFYIADRLLVETGLASPWRELGIGLIALLGVGLIAQPIAERTMHPSRARFIAWPAALWMGFAFLLINALAVSDLVLWLGGGVARAASGTPLSGDSTAAIRGALVVVGALVAGGFGLRAGMRMPQLVRREITLDRWPEALDGFRIIQLSDIHIGPLLRRSFAEYLVEQANACAPDLIVITGDLVDGGVEQLADEVAPFAQLSAPHGVFFVTGNHDHYSGAHSWCDVVSGMGITVLRNRRVSVAQGGDEFDLVGVDDHRGGHLGDDGREDLAEALTGRDPARPAILLAHDPSTFKQACRLGIDLQISGHTHGGQIWPFGHLVRLVVPFVAGRYRRHGAELYVSRGTGFWGPPMRLGAPAEITEIVLRHGGETAYGTIGTSDADEASTRSWQQ